jgi:hypothetical protein
LGAALLALAASVGWGLGDFLGGVKARALPSLLVLAWKRLLLDAKPRPNAR